MSLWSKIKSKVKSGYTSLDKKLGGYLPGGVAPGSSSSSSSSSNKSSSSSSSSSSNSSSSSGTSSSSSGSSSNSSNSSSSSSLANQIKTIKTTTGSSGSSSSSNEAKVKSIDVYTPDTRTQAEKDAITEIQKQARINKLKENLKSYYDRSVGLLFSEVPKAIKDEFISEKKDIERKNYGNAGMEWNSFDAPGTGGKGTIIKEYNKLSNDELLEKSPYTATDIVTNRESVKINEKAKNIANEIQEKKQEEIEKQFNDWNTERTDYYQNQIQKGETNWKDANDSYIAEAQIKAEELTKSANEEMNNEFITTMTPEIEKSQKYVEEYDKKAGRNRAKSEIGVNFLTGALVGGAIALTGGVGLVLGGAQLGRTALDSGEIYKTYQQDKLKFGLEVIPQLVGGLAGAKGIGMLKGEGNIRLANKVSKIPKNLEMQGIVNYLKYMKTIPVSKLKKIIGPEGEFTIKAKGGDLTILREGKGIINAVRKGKNWNEIIRVGPDEVVEGLITRSFKNKFGKNIDYFIKYKILQNGKRITEYFKGNKKFSTIKDEVKPDYVITEEIPAKSLKGKKEYALTEEGVKVKGANENVDYYLGDDMNLYSKEQLETAKSVKESYGVKETTQKITDAKKGKYKSEGEIKNVYGEYELDIADPIEFTKAIKIAKKNKNSVALAILKEVEKKRAKISEGKGVNKDILKMGNVKEIIGPEGQTIKVQMVKEMKTPTLEIVSKNIKGTTFKIEQSKNPGIAIKTLDKINKALIDEAINGNKVYMMSDPITGVLTRVRMPQLKVKTSALKINEGAMKTGVGKIMALPKELSIEQIKYLIGVGALDVRNLLNVLRNEKNLIIKEEITNLNRIREKIRQLQLQQQKMGNKAMMNMKLSELEKKEFESPEMKKPNLPNMKPGVVTPPLIFIDSLTKVKNGNAKFNAEEFKQLRYNDPLEALTGKKRYSNFMNIKLTGRYGNFYS